MKWIWETITTWWHQKGWGGHKGRTSKTGTDKLKKCWISWREIGMSNSYIPILSIASWNASTNGEDGVFLMVQANGKWPKDSLNPVSKIITSFLLERTGRMTESAARRGSGKRGIWMFWDNSEQLGCSSMIPHVANGSLSSRHDYTGSGYIHSSLRHFEELCTPESCFSTIVNIDMPGIHNTTLN